MKYQEWATYQNSDLIVSFVGRQQCKIASKQKQSALNFPVANTFLISVILYCGSRFAYCIAIYPSHLSLLQILYILAAFCWMTWLLHWGTPVPNAVFHTIQSATSDLVRQRSSACNHNLLWSRLYLQDADIEPSKLFTPGPLSHSYSIYACPEMFRRLHVMRHFGSWDSFNHHFKVHSSHDYISNSPHAPTINSEGWVGQILWNIQVSPNPD